MPYSTSPATRIASPVLVGLILVSTVAEAQISPGGGMPGAGPQQQQEEKKEGVAEAAPKAPGLLPTTPALPPSKGRRKRWKLFEIDGYFRLRTDWFKNFHLGHIDRADLGGASFPRSLDCGTEAIRGAGCDDTLAGTNMRLRLEPVINLDEGTSIHIQADVLDNLVLGSTPTNEAYNGVYNTAGHPPPLGAFGGGTQAPPQAGVNSDRDSIVIKRAWAEVAVPLGILKAGRQPNHWGMGIWNNSGGYDPIAGTYDLDGDYGDSVDRVSFSALIPGTNLRAMIASDWQISRLVSNQTPANVGHEGHAFNLGDDDDMNAWVGVISRMDSPQEFRDKVDRGELALNYGVYFEYRTQEWDNNLSGFTLGGTLDAATRYVPRSLTTYSPDVWGKLGYGKVTLEGEIAAQIGSIDSIELLGQDAAGGETLSVWNAKIRKFGGVGRLTWKGLEGKLRIGFEGGAASGDQWDNTPAGNTNVAFANLIGDPTAETLTQFIFNREYKVDMILFRHLIGAVTNAGYAKPFLSYDLTKSIGFKVANITSFALKPVATPGNGRMYGTEFNADIGYSSGGIYAGISYGVLFPFSALSHPAAEGSGFTADPNNPNIDNTGDAGTAHTIQSRLVLKF